MFENLFQTLFQTEIYFRSTILKVRLALSFCFLLVGYLLPLIFKLI